MAKKMNSICIFPFGFLTMRIILKNETVEWLLLTENGSLAYEQDSNDCSLKVQSSQFGKDTERTVK